MLSIFAITLKEIVRRRFLLVTLLLAGTFLLLYGFGVHYSASNMTSRTETAELRIMIGPQFLSLGIFFGSFIVSFLAVMAAVGTISAEIENGTIFAIVSRPIRRSEIVLGKFCAYALTLCAFAALFYLAVLFIVNSGTGLHVAIKPGPLALYILQPLILLAVTMFGSTVFPTLANGIAVFMLYSIGILGGMMEQIGYITKTQTLVNVGIVSSLIMPTDSVYRKIVSMVLPASNFLGPFGSAVEPSVWMLLYTGIYVLTFLALAIGYFSRRDISQDA